jgi:DNA-binding SARP family transcriptional activator
MGVSVEYRLLGDVAALVGGEPVDLGHLRQRSLIAVMLVEANRAVSTDQLIDRAWGDHRPSQASNTLYSYLSRLRRALADADNVELTRSSGGYLLRVDESSVDLHRFRQLLRQARESRDAEHAVALFEQALALWRGDPLPGLDTPWFDDVRRVLDKELYAAQLDHADRALDAGHHASMVSELSQRVAAHPLDERIAGQLMLALYHSGRQADALRHYEQMRVLLADGLGVDPSPLLRQLHRDILRGDLPPSQAHHDDNDRARTSPPAAPRQLPGVHRSFVGRVAELAGLTAALTPAMDPGWGTAITVISGAGGTGKSWLALRWADEHRGAFPDAQLFVNLRGFAPSGQPVSPATAIRGFLDALGVPPAAVPREPAAQVGLYRSLVAGRRILIVLDDAHDSDQVDDLLPGATSGAVIVTSRDRLAGLVTRHGAQPVPLDVLADTEAYRLLAGRLGDERLAREPDAVATVVAACAGLPLALAIAAARMAAQPGHPLAAIAAELSDATTRLSALDEGEAPASLRAVLSGSYRALTPSQARVFALLGSAPGADIGMPAAAALTRLSHADVSVAFRELERHSLLQQHAPGRWRMHDLVRLYAQEQATHRPEDERPALRRLVLFWVHTAWTAARLLAPHRPALPLDEDTLATSPHPLPDQAAANAWLDGEYACLLAGQRMAMREGWYPAVWQLAWTLHTYQHRRGYLPDTMNAWQVALTAARHAADPIEQIRAHRQLGRVYSDLNRHTEAIEQLRHALTLADVTGDRASQAEALLTLGQVYGVVDDNEQALIHSTEAMHLYEAMDNPVRHAVALNAVGWHETRLGRYGPARVHLDAALTLHHQNSDRTYLADTLDSRGYLALRTGEHTQALRYFEEALTVLRELADAYGEADTLKHLGHTHAALGDRDQADRNWRTALRLYTSQHRISEADNIRRLLDTST